MKICNSMISCILMYADDMILICDTEEKLQQSEELYRGVV